MSLRGKRVLVTGGSGFIGARIVEKLILEHGAVPRVLVRKLANAARIARFGVDIFPGDVTNEASVAKAIDGCDVVIHCAYGKEGDHEHRRAVNVDGTAIVAREALRSGVYRMVHVSTIAVYGRTPDGDVDESTPLADAGDHYSKTKREAEQILQDQHGSSGLSFTIIRPTCVYGPYGLAFTIDPIQQLGSSRVVLVNGGEGLCNAIYVDDLADGILLAAVEPAASSETFLMTAETPITWRVFYDAYERLLGRRSTVEMTVEQLRAYARHEAERKAWEEDTSERLQRIGVAYEIEPRREPFRVPSEHGLAFYSARTRFRIDKAKRLLGFRPTFSFEDGIALTGQWARWAGMIPTKGNV
jgi:nucleoside-diphosphate-sugar epimerase